jgi:hypothetical protein
MLKQEIEMKMKYTVTLLHFSNMKNQIYFNEDRDSICRPAYSFSYFISSNTTSFKPIIFLNEFAVAGPKPA